MWFSFHFLKHVKRNRLVAYQARQANLPVGLTRPWHPCSFHFVCRSVSASPKRQTGMGKGKKKKTWRRIWPNSARYGPTELDWRAMSCQGPYLWGRQGPDWPQLLIYMSTSPYYLEKNVERESRKHDKIDLKMLISIFKNLSLIY